jgi:hypothetical protein
VFRIEQVLELQVGFVSEDAGFRSTFGWYDSATGEAHILAANTDADTNPGIENFTADLWLTPEQLGHLGFFLIPNGYPLNGGPGEPLAGGDPSALDLKIFDDGGVWTIRDEGSGHVFEGKGAAAYFTDPAMNPDGMDHVDEVGDLATTGAQELRWEDLPDLGDRSFDDAVFEIRAVSTVQTGTPGDDTLIGGGGSDRFVFLGTIGADTIGDFEKGADTIELRGYGDDLDTFAELEISVQNGNSLIELTASLADGTDAGSILVEGVTGLEADDFAFG